MDTITDCIMIPGKNIKGPEAAFATNNPTSLKNVQPENQSVKTSRSDYENSACKRLTSFQQLEHTTKIVPFSVLCFPTGD